MQSTVSYTVGSGSSISLEKLLRSQLVPQLYRNCQSHDRNLVDLPFRPRHTSRVPQPQKGIPGQLRGDVVLVRTFGGKAVKLRVWSVNHSRVFITNDEEYEKLVAGKTALDPIAFPGEDIFCVPATLSVEEPLDWSQLLPWPGQKED